MPNISDKVANEVKELAAVKGHQKVGATSIPVVYAPAQTQSANVPAGANGVPSHVVLTFTTPQDATKQIVDAGVHVEINGVNDGRNGASSYLSNGFTAGHFWETLKYYSNNTMTVLVIFFGTTTAYNASATVTFVSKG